MDVASRDAEFSVTAESATCDARVNAKELLVAGQVLVDAEREVGDGLRVGHWRPEMITATTAHCLARANHVEARWRKATHAVAFVRLISCLAPGSRAG